MSRRLKKTKNLLTRKKRAVVKSGMACKLLCSDNDALDYMFCFSLM